MDAGADAIGLNFYDKSSRFLTIAQAVEISSQAIPFVSTVAVLVNPDSRYVEDILRVVRPDYLQFHGDESPEFCAGFGVPYIKAIRVFDTIDLASIEKEFHSARGLLLDSHIDGQYGGTGNSFDWQKTRSVSKMSIILAGGLNPDNVESAISAVLPYAVDVSSGVEIDGKKDPNKISEFCKKVQNCS